MNRSKISIEQICNLENCKLAIRNASKNKRKRKSVKKVLDNIDEYAAKLMEFLTAKNLRFNEGAIATINEGTNRKQRNLCKPPFYPDQCAHWAIMQVVSPVLVKGFYKYSCASIKGRGTHYAKHKLECSFKDIKNTKYCLQLDIKSFYASIDKDVLVKLLSNKIKDKRVVNLLGKVIYSYSGSGLPLGYYTSSFLANFYLSPLDRLIKEELHIKYYVRYMDDMVMYSSSKRKLHSAKRIIEKFIADNLKLKLKHTWQVYKMPYDNGKGKVTSQRATGFLGYKYYRYKTTIRKSIFKRMLRLFRRLHFGEYTVKAAHSFAAYNGYLKCTNSKKVLLKYVDGKFNKNILREMIRDETRTINSRK